MEVYRPKDGYTQNPLRAGEHRNKPCLCGSGKKTKKCCGAKLFMPVKMAAKVKEIHSGHAAKLEIIEPGQP